MSVIWYKVWSDLWHNKIRTLLAILSIAVGVFAIGVIFGMSDQLLTGMDTSHQNDIPSHINMFLTRRIDEEMWKYSIRSRSATKPARKASGRPG
jgi:putative ABC transport system permease protein